jgi:hypothetical protein
MLAAALFASMLALPVPGQAKTLPPAFGKELVPDKASSESEEKEADIEEKQERPAVQRSRRGGRAQKLHIQLDGDEDGGGIDGDGDGDGGEF